MKTLVKSFSFIAFFCILFFYINSGYSSAIEKQAAIPENMYLAGEYTRTWKLLWVIPLIKLYEVKFFTTKPEEVIEKFKQSQPEKTDTDHLSEFITDPENNFSYCLVIEPLISQKAYPKEKKAMMLTLKNSGFPVDDNWVLQKRNSFQEEVRNYVHHIIGLSKEKPGVFYENRKAKDNYILLVEYNKKATVSYIPHSTNKKATKGDLVLEKTDLLRGVIMTYISKKHCSEELRNKLPSALMSEFAKRL